MTRSAAVGETAVKVEWKKMFGAEIKMLCVQGDQAVLACGRVGSLSVNQPQPRLSETVLLELKYCWFSATTTSFLASLSFSEVDYQLPKGRSLLLCQVVAVVINTDKF